MSATLTWQEVEEYGIQVVNLHNGDKFVAVLADHSDPTGSGFEEVVGEITHHGVASVTVLLNRSKRGGGRETEITTWAPEAKVIKV